MHIKHAAVTLPVCNSAMLINGTSVCVQKRVEPELARAASSLPAALSATNQRTYHLVALPHSQADRDAHSRFSGCILLRCKAARHEGLEGWRVSRATKYNDYEMIYRRRDHRPVRLRGRNEARAGRTDWLGLYRIVACLLEETRGIGNKPSRRPHINNLLLCRGSKETGISSISEKFV